MRAAFEKSAATICSGRMRSPASQHEKSPRPLPISRTFLRLRSRSGSRFLLTNACQGVSFLASTSRSWCHASYACRASRPSGRIATYCRERRRFATLSACEQQHVLVAHSVPLVGSCSGLRSSSQPFSQLDVSHESADGPCQTTGVERRHEQSVHVVLENIRRCADCRCNNRQSHRHRFEQGRAKALR